jgi:hypothetical protein
MSPNRWRFIQIEADPSAEVIAEGDHRITDESVDVDSKVGVESDGVAGLQEREVTPASWPIKSASNVTEKR